MDKIIAVNEQTAGDAINETENDAAFQLDENVVSFEPASFDSSNENLDHFTHEEDLSYAGTHLIIDLWGASRLDDLGHIEATLRQAVDACKATLLHIHLHHFTPNGGVSGVAVLAESHISIHTWPERDYAALDVFMCGDAEPHKAIPILREAFQPEQIQLGDHKRGVL